VPAGRPPGIGFWICPGCLGALAVICWCTHRRGNTCTRCHTRNRAGDQYR
jgi:hypothetical protein